MARNHNRIAVMIVAVALTAVAGFIAWSAIYPPDVPHFALVIDRSGSPAFPVCPAVSALVRQALAAPGAVKESHLTLIATGDKSNDFQGMLLKRTFLAKKREATRIQRKQVQREDTYVDEMAASCASLTSTPARRS